MQVTAESSSAWPLWGPRSCARGRVRATEQTTQPKETHSMAFVVAEPCIACKYTDCVAVCPVDCFYEGENFLVIHPDECIDCGACEPVCPTKAIFPEDDLPEKWKEYTALNADLSTKWPNINKQKEGLPDAEQNKEKEGKRGMLSMNPFAG